MAYFVVAMRKLCGISLSTHTTTQTCANVTTTPTVYLCLDHADLLFKPSHTHPLSHTRKHGAFLASLFGVRETARCSMCVILICESCEPFSLTRTLPLGHRLIPIRFKAYSSEELVDMLSRVCVDPLLLNGNVYGHGYGHGHGNHSVPVFPVSRALYRRFVSYIVHVFEHGSRNIHELRYIIKILFPLLAERQCECARERERLSESERNHTKTANKRKRKRPSSTNMSLIRTRTQVHADNESDIATFQSLLVKLRPVCKAFLDKLFYRNLGGIPLVSSLSTSPLLVTGEREQELPLSCKYLLIASFLASYNPAQMDVRMFSPMHHRRKRRRRRRSRVTSSNTTTNKGQPAIRTRSRTKVTGRTGRRQVRFVYGVVFLVFVMVLGELDTHLCVMCCYFPLNKCVAL